MSDGCSLPPKLRNTYEVKAAKGVASAKAVICFLQSARGRFRESSDVDSASEVGAIQTVIQRQQSYSWTGHTFVDDESKENEYDSNGDPCYGTLREAGLFC